MQLRSIVPGRAPPVTVPPGLASRDWRAPAGGVPKSRISRSGAPSGDD